MEKVKFFCDIILKNIKNSVIIKVGKIGKNIKIKLKKIKLFIAIWTFLEREDLIMKNGKVVLVGTGVVGMSMA